MPGSSPNASSSYKYTVESYSTYLPVPRYLLQEADAATYPQSKLGSVNKSAKVLLCISRSY